MVVLGIEGGGTRTTATLVDAADQVLASVTAGPGNLRLLADDQLTALLDSIRDQLPAKPDRIGVGMAGVCTAADRDRLRRLHGPARLGQSRSSRRGLRRHSRCHRHAVSR